MGESKIEFMKRAVVGRTRISEEVMSEFYDILSPMPEEGRMLDIGTCDGDSATFCAMLKPKWTVYTVDYFDLFPLKNLVSAEFNRAINETDRHKVFSTLVYGYPNIIPMVHDAKTLPWELPVDFLFIDADHSYEGVLHDFLHYSPFLKPGGRIAFHDYGVDHKDFGVTKFIDELTGWQKKIVHDLAIIWK